MARETRVNVELLDPLALRGSPVRRVKLVRLDKPDLLDLMERR